jgi:iron(III) transport system substrate-binding protein
MAAAALFLALPATAHSEGDVNVYSFREPYLIEPLLAAFEAKTGIKPHVIFAKDGLVERIVAEGPNSPADVLLTNEFGLLTLARDAGITAPVSSKTLEEAIPSSYRDPAGQWFGLTVRARVVYASKERVAEEAIAYEDLADTKWKGRICSRSGQHTYNVALVASMIAHHGEAKAKEWLKGVKENLARKPSGSDRDQIKAVFAGECDISIGNTYYMGLMQTNEKNPEQKEWAAAVKLLFPNAGDRGTHVNISGAALLKHAPHAENAVKLIEYLASAEAQALYATANNEYPIRADVAASPTVQAWGALKPDGLALEEIAKLRKRASEIVDEVGFDEGPSS